MPPRLEPRVRVDFERAFYLRLGLVLDRVRVASLKSQFRPEVGRVRCSGHCGFDGDLVRAQKVEKVLIEGLHPDPASMIGRIQKLMEAALD